MNKVQKTLLFFFFTISFSNLFSDQSIKTCPYDFAALMRKYNENKNEDYFMWDYRNFEFEEIEQKIDKLELLMKEKNLDATVFTKIINEEVVENQEEFKAAFFSLIKDLTQKETDKEALEAIKASATTK